jgi:hypothetical protein
MEGNLEEKPSVIEGKIRKKKNTLKSHLSAHGTESIQFDGRIDVRVNIASF